LSRSAATAGEKKTFDSEGYRTRISQEPSQLPDDMQSSLTATWEPVNECVSSIE